MCLCSFRKLFLRLVFLQLVWPQTAKFNNSSYAVCYNIYLEQRRHCVFMVFACTVLVTIPKTTYEEFSLSHIALCHFLHYFFFTFSAELTQQEINGVSFILRRLSSTTFRPVASGHLSHHLDHLDSSLLELFMQSLVQLTCLCAHRAVQEEEVCVCVCVCVCVRVCGCGVGVWVCVCMCGVCVYVWCV